MGLFDKVSELGIAALDRAATAAGTLAERARPVLERSRLGARVIDGWRERFGDAALDDVPDPTAGEPPSPFAPVPRPPDVVLGNSDVAAQIYGRGTCPWTGRALQLLSDRDIAHVFVDLEAEGGAHIEAQLRRETRQDRTPYVYLRGELLGGWQALEELDRLGLLEERVRPAAERGAARGGVRIVVPHHGADVFEGERGAPDDRK
jgi:glutaredoxin